MFGFPMRWFEVNPQKLAKAVPGKSDWEKKVNALDLKYGGYDYSCDLRPRLHDEFLAALKSIIVLPARPGVRMLLAGANNGHEIPYFPGYEITAVDLSPRALRELKKSYPNVGVIQSDVCDLPFRDGRFDLYVALRTFQSSGVDIKLAVSECVRVIKDDGCAIVSVPNGYWIDGNVIKGLYRYDELGFNKSAPYAYVDMIRSHFKRLGCVTQMVDAGSELLVQAIKQR